jgi:aryl-alcohol dehydrogenase-like predicted oxidoreductase
MSFTPTPDAVSPLNRYRILSPNASVRVSPLCLGAMSLGTAWKHWMDGVEKEEAFELLDYFFAQGGNFIDVIVPDKQLS